MKRLLTVLMVILLMVTTNLAVMANSNEQAKTRSDVPEWAVEEYNQAEFLWQIIPESFGYKDLNDEISRAEFCEIITIASLRLGFEMPEDIDDDVFSDVNNRYINSAYHLGIINGYPDGTFRPNMPVTRETLFKIIGNFLAVVGNDDVIDGAGCDKILHMFTDRDEVSAWAKSAVAFAKYKGILKGSGDNRIHPKKTASRIEGVLMTVRTLKVADVMEVKVVYGDSDADGSSALDSDVPAPVDDSPAAAAVSDNTAMVGEAMTSAAIEPWDVYPSKNLYRLGYNNDKHRLIFGSGSKYQSSGEALANMVTVTIDVWKIDSSGNKYPSTLSLKVNKNLEAPIKAIFAEIFSGDEKFPIKTIDGYAWRSNTRSEHRLGLAVDINPNENCMVLKDGRIVSGSYWRPGSDPYSIPANGDVVNAFKRFGFTWGGNAWRSCNDYMHFSYFGN